MEKIYWCFLKKVMLKMGFRPAWIDIVMHCIKTTSFSFVINGELRGYVIPSRELR